MPVIGRLDDQVDRILIEPRAREDDEEASAGEREATRTINQRDERVATARQRPREGDGDTLPVWLL